MIETPKSTTNVSNDGMTAAAEKGPERSEGQKVKRSGGRRDEEARTHHCVEGDLDEEDMLDPGTPVVRVVRIVTRL